MTQQLQFSIGELAQEFDITTRTIRYYEDKKLINPARRGQQRVYSRTDRTRLKLILRGKRLGWTLDEIMEVIELYSAGPEGEKRQLELLLAKIKVDRATLLDRQQDVLIALRELETIEERALQQLDAVTKPLKTNNQA